MAYDAAHQRVVLFGGLGGSGDTWVWDGTTWTQLTPSASPSARYLHAMAYDAARQRVVLFGGSPGSVAFGDTWEWDGTTWFARFSLNYPSPRYGHAMAYDAARQRVVLFGGYGNSGDLGDTWEWDGTNWLARFSLNYPSPRRGHAMAYDAARQRVVLFGGYNPSILGDTWEWDGTNWVQRTPVASPVARWLYAMAYDAARQRVALFGGESAIPPGYYRDDTWEWGGTNWTQLTPSASPSPRFGLAMAYDEARQRVVLFGGFNGSLFNNTWINGTPLTSASATAYGAGCGSPALGFVPDANGRPVLGQTASATILNAPAPIAFVAMGLNNQFFGPFTLPVTLGGIGMPGCDLWQSTDILGLGVSLLTPTTLSYSLAIPNVPSLIGMHLYLQAYAYAPGYNPAQIVISNGIDWMLGNT